MRVKGKTAPPTASTGYLLKCDNCGATGKEMWEKQLNASRYTIDVSYHHYECEMGHPSDPHRATTAIVSKFIDWQKTPPRTPNQSGVGEYLFVCSVHFAQVVPFAVQIYCDRCHES